MRSVLQCAVFRGCRNRYEFFIDSLGRSISGPRSRAPQDHMHDRRGVACTRTTRFSQQCARPPRETSDSSNGRETRGLHFRCTHCTCVKPRAHRGSLRHIGGGQLSISLSAPLKQSHAVANVSSVVFMYKRAALQHTYASFDASCTGVERRAASSCPPPGPRPFPETESPDSFSSLLRNYRSGA
jgi:hypothetical protein